jgi:phosphoribosylaminoimidazole (AIR) synthetase
MRTEAMNIIIERSKLSLEDLYETFNMGIGLVIACHHPDLLMKELHEMNEKSMILGKVTKQKGLKLF